jgi:hypothetical protein
MGKYILIFSFVKRKIVPAPFANHLGRTSLGETWEAGPRVRFVVVETPLGAAGGAIG